MFLAHSSSLVQLLAPLFTIINDDQASYDCHNMASMTKRGSEETVDTLRLDLQAFASVWSALRANYEGTNITKTIARLLKMYQPEEGIQAYERLLKTLYVLLDDFDKNGLRLLVSMVPPPKGSSDEDIKNTFLKATGFLRMNAPILQQSDLPGSARASPNDAYSFRGMSSTKADVSHSRTFQRSDCRLQGNPQVYSHPHCFERQADAINIHPQSFKMDWLQTPYPIQNRNASPARITYGDFIMKTPDNKYIRIPAANINPSGIHFYHPCQIISPDRQPSKPVLRKNHTATSDFETNISLSLSLIPGAANKWGGKEEIGDKNRNYSSETSKPSRSEDSKDGNSVLSNLEVSENLASCINRFLNRVKDPQNMTIHENIDVQLKRKKFCTSSDEKLGFSQPLLFMQPPTPEMAAYRKQYYDTLQNLQRARVVAASSLARDCNPYQSEYLQQHHWLYQQRMIMGLNQYTAHRMMQPEIPLQSNEWMAQCPSVRQSPFYDSCYVHSPQESAVNGIRPMNRELKKKDVPHELNKLVAKLKKNEITSTKTNNKI